MDVFGSIELKWSGKRHSLVSFISHHCPVHTSDTASPALPSQHHHPSSSAPVMLATSSEHPPTWAMSWIIVNTDIPNPTRNYCHRNYYRDFPFLLEQHHTAQQGHSCFWGTWDVSFGDVGSLQLPSALNLALLAPRHGLEVEGEGLFSWGFSFLLLL